MRGGEGLVQVDVHGINAKVAGANLADDGVEVRAVAVEERAHRMHGLGDLDDVRLEQAAGVRVGQHDRRHVRTQPRLQRLEIHAAVGGRRNFLNAVAAERSGCRVGTVSRFRHQHNLAGIAACLKGGTDGEQAAQLAVRASLRRHGDGGHARQFHQPVRHRIDQLQRALHRVLRLQRVNVGEARQTGHLLIQARVVLHGARTQREQAHVDCVILAAEARVVAHGFRFGETRQADRRFTLQPAEARGNLGRFRHVNTGAVATANLEDQRFVEVQTLMAGEGLETFSARAFAGSGRASLTVQHDSTSSRPFASASMSDSVTISVTASTTPSCSAVSVG